MKTDPHQPNSHADLRPDRPHAAQDAAPSIRYTRRASKIVVPLRRTFVTSRLQDAHSG